MEINDKIYVFYGPFLNKNKLSAHLSYVESYGLLLDYFASQTYTNLSLYCSSIGIE